MNRFYFILFFEYSNLSRVVVALEVCFYANAYLVLATGDARRVAAPLIVFCIIFKYYDVFSLVFVAETGAGGIPGGLIKNPSAVTACSLGIGE